MKYYVDWKEWLTLPFIMQISLLDDLKDEYEPGEKILVFIILLLSLAITFFSLLTLPFTWILFIKRRD